MKKMLVVFWCLSLAALLSFSLSITSHEYTSNEQKSFVINKPYLSVVKSMATKESLEKTVEEDKGTVTNKRWQNFTIEVPQRILRIKDYSLEGLLYFTVEKPGGDLGRLSLDFEQNISVNKNAFLVKINLREPQRNVKVYNKVIEISPLADDPLKTQVFIRSELSVLKLIPFFFKSVMDKKVLDANSKDLESISHNIMRITEDTSPVIKF